MSGPENTFTASVHRHLPPDLYRMKTHNPYISGPADVWYSGSKRDLWVEYKFLAVPKRPTTVIDLTAGKDPALSVLQQDWLNERYAEGRNVWVIVGCKAGGVLLKDKDWMQPRTVANFQSALQTRAELATALRYFLESP
jgi:hypothetical protein